MPRADECNMQKGEGRRIGTGEAPGQDGHLGSCCCVAMRAAVLGLTEHSDTLSTARGVGFGQPRAATHTTKGCKPSKNILGGFPAEKENKNGFLNTCAL